MTPLPDAFRSLARLVPVALLVVVTGCTGSACTHAATEHRPPPIEAGTAAASAIPTPTAPLVTGEWMQRLELPDQGFASVTPPLGATARRPIVVSVHGASDIPEVMCSSWRAITDGFAFVVCPAGTAVGGGRYTWGSAEQLEKRVLEAIAAVEATWPDNVERGAPVVYTAFSQGATTAGPVLTRHADRMPRAVLSEGGYRVFDERTARAYAAKGGERVLFECSSSGCAGGFAPSVAALARSNVKAQIEDAGPLGHSLPPPAREGLNRQLPFVVEGLRGWEAYATHPRLPSH